MDQWNAFTRVGNKGHLSMEREYAQVQVQRGAQEPNQRQKRENREKEKAAKTRVSHISGLTTWYQSLTDPRGPSLVEVESRKKTVL